jgi:mannobiose 2-epimerase
LHILEPYTNLLRIWRDDKLVAAQKQLINDFCNHIVSSETHHLILFFDNQWNPFPHPKSKAFSYGHDIESSWLLYEAAEVLGDEELLAKVKPVCMNITKAAYEGLQDDGSLIYESIPFPCGGGLHFDRDRHWWVQSEAVVGSVYAAKISGDAGYLQKAQQTWEYIKKYIIDKENGEWFWGASPDGQPDRESDKAGFWKCPYHNARMCMEIMEL